VILNRGASSKDQPARVPEDPVNVESVNVFLMSAQRRDSSTIVNHNCYSVAAARLRFLIPIWSGLDGFLEMSFSRRVQPWRGGLILWFCILHWSIDRRRRHSGRCGCFVVGKALGHVGWL